MQSFRSVFGRPQNNSSWTNSETVFRVAVCGGFLRNGTIIPWGSLLSVNCTGLTIPSLPHVLLQMGCSGKDFVFSLRGSGTLVFVAGGEPICALQACMYILQVAAIENVAPETDISVSSHK